MDENRLEEILKLDNTSVEKFAEKMIKKYHQTPQVFELPDVAIAYRTRKKMWVLLEHYCYYTDDGDLIIAKKRFCFDLASIHRLFWLLIAPFELSIPAPLFHDLLYRNKGELSKEQIIPFRSYTRKEADQLFRELMLKSSIPKWKCNLAYYIVRLFAWFAWKKRGDADCFSK